LAKNAGLRRGREQAPEIDDAQLDACEDQFVVRALSRGLRVLALFTPDHSQWALSDLARATGLHKATAYRMTRTMEVEGFLVFDLVTSTYHLGPAMIPVSYLAQAHSELARIARPYLEQVVQETGETGNLGIEVEGTFVIIGQVLTPNVFKPSLPLGPMMKDISNAHGKVFAAFRSPSERAKILARPQPRKTQHEPTDSAQTAAELDRVVAEGVAYDLEDHGPGVCSAAAPVWGKDGALIATLAVVAPKERFGETEKDRAAEVVKRVAADLSAYLGYSDS
jgi:DNA-binding IclR family transcriptional regulator